MRMRGFDNVEDLGLKDSMRDLGSRRSLVEMD